MSTAATIPTDLPCVGCAYNLRGLAAAGRCPECGLPVEHALRGELAAGYRRRLRLGALLSSGGYAGTLLMLAALAWTGWLMQGRRAVSVVVVLVLLAGGAATLAGVWLVTVRNPMRGGTEPPWSARRVSRVALQALAACVAALVPIVATLRAVAVTPSPFAWLLDPALPLTAGLFVTFILAHLRHIELLGRQLEMKSVEGAAQSWRWAFVFGLMLCVVTYFIPESLCLVGPGGALLFVSSQAAIILPYELASSPKLRPRPPTADWALPATSE